MTLLNSSVSKLIDMRMSVFAHTYQEQSDDPISASLDFDERLAMLIDAEWDSRRTNKRTRLLRGADFSCPDACISDIRYDPDRKLDKDRIIELSHCTWIKEHRNLIVTGATGAGKSWLGCALGVAACNNFYSVRYVRMPQLLDELCVKKDEEWLKIKKKYITCDLLIIDDWMLEPLSSEQARELLEIVESRNQSGSLMLCSQFSAGGWTDKIGEGAVAEAIVYRIIHNSYVIHIEGEESMRKRMSGIE